MNFRTASWARAATFIAVGAASIASAATAVADEAAAPSTHNLGSQATLTNGGVVQGWTISNLKQSSDSLDYAVQGTLWEATATDEALQGSVTPIVSNLNARSASGQNYRVLYQVASPQGVNPGTISQGEKTSGKVYFDVTGDNPNSVVYNAGGHDCAIWVQPPPATGGSGSSVVGNAPAAAPATNPSTAAPAAANGQTPGATPAGTPSTNAPTGSQGTPIAEGSQGTPLPAGTQENPAGTPSGTQEAPAGTQQAPSGTQEAPAGTQEAPAGAPAGTQQAPPAAGQAPASGGAQEAPAGTSAGTQQAPAAGGQDSAGSAAPASAGTAPAGNAVAPTP